MKQIPKISQKEECPQPGDEHIQTPAVNDMFVEKDGRLLDPGESAFFPPLFNSALGVPASEQCEK